MEKFEIDQIEMSKRKAKLDETDHPNCYDCLLMNFDEQVQRIKEKLVLVRAKESKTQVFGAENHQYKLAEPYSQTMVLMFESEHHGSRSISRFHHSNWRIRGRAVLRDQ